jgi:two-component system sensor histidine kinase BaeS
LPDGITRAHLDVPALQNGSTVSGSVGNLVYAVAPAQLTVEERSRLHFDGTFAILLTRDVGDLGPSWVYFIVAGAVGLAVAALVAAQMSRRMARPLVEAEVVTARIASGELASRVPVRPNDYPEFASLAGSINDMAQSLEDSRARERHLLLAVSHDLRTPLTSIRGFAEAIQDGAIEDSSQAADVIIAEARRLERLVGDLLDLTKLEARQMSISLRPTDAAEVASTTAEGFRPAAAKNGLQIRVHVAGHENGGSPQSPDVVADPDRLAQLLANLIENAITYAETVVAVGVTDYPEAGVCLITVDDDGPGIAEADLHRVFERFYRADRGPNRRMGSGLGLAIVAELATAMGGSVRAESPLGPTGGSRFVVTLGYWRGSVPQLVPV